MSTDNSKIAQNFEIGRSYFDIARKTHTSQKLGSVAVSDVQFCIPRDTIKHSTGRTYELKPTTDRIVSKVYAEQRSFAVPIRQVWKYFNEFLGKHGDFIATGALNTTYMMRKETETAPVLPHFNPRSVLGAFLACISPTGNRHLWTLNDYDPTELNDTYLNGNCLPMYYDYINRFGLLVRHQSPDGSYIPWWFPRLLGDGVLTSGVNCQYVDSSVVEGVTNPYLYVTFNSPEIVTQAKLLYEFMKANNAGTSFSLATNDVTHLGVAFSWSSTTSSVEISVFVGANGYELPPVVWGDLNTTALANAMATTETGLHHYGTLFTHLQTAGYTGVSSVSDNVVPILVGSDADPIRKYALNLAITAIFNRPELLGFGSLSEQLGVHFFDTKNIYQIATEVAGGNFPVALGVSDTALFPILAWDILDAPQTEFSEPQTNQLINPFPFFAYQKFCTERLLLPHNVLSNNQGENTDTDLTAQYDSPFYRNNLVPTMYYGKPAEGEILDILVNSGVYVSNERENIRWVNAGSSDTFGTDLTDAEYKQPINQLLSVFLSRGVLLDMDVFNRIWQKENENVDNILQASGFGVNDNNTINAKLFLLAKKLARFVRFGNTDQTTDAVLANHFGVNDIPDKVCNTIMLASERNEVDIQDVLNTGGGVDQNGNALALGERKSIATKTIPMHNSYTCFVPEFSYLFDVHFFNVEQLRTNVPDPSQTWLQKLTRQVGDFRRNFQLMFFPEFQDSGDEQLLLSDVVANSTDTAIGWSNKNQTLKDGYNDVKGEFRTKYYKMLITPYPAYRNNYTLPSLTYGYFQPSPYQYDLHLVDRFGDAFLISHYRETTKKSTFTKDNSVGFNL